MPLMRLYAIGPSILFNSTDNMSFPIPAEPSQFDFDQFKWNREIPMQDAIDLLEKTMYPFKEVRDTISLFLSQANQQHPVSTSLYPEI